MIYKYCFHWSLH